MHACHVVAKGAELCIIIYLPPWCLFRPCAVVFEYASCWVRISECVYIFASTTYIQSAWVHKCLNVISRLAFISVLQMTLDRLTSGIFNPPLSLHSAWHSGPFSLHWPLFDTHTHTHVQRVYDHSVTLADRQTQWETQRIPFPRWHKRRSQINGLMGSKPMADDH